MAISEDRLYMLLPRQLKRAVSDRAERMGISVGEYVRRLIQADLQGSDGGVPAVEFPFGRHPVKTGRTKGSIEHDRPA